MYLPVNETSCYDQPKTPTQGYYSHADVTIRQRGTSPQSAVTPIK